MKIAKSMKLGLVRNGIEISFNGNTATVARVSNFPGKDYSVSTVLTEDAYIDIKNDTVVELSDREAWIQNKIDLNSKGNINSDYERGMADAYRDIYDRLIGTT